VQPGAGAAGRGRSASATVIPCPVIQDRGDLRRGPAGQLQPQRGGLGEQLRVRADHAGIGPGRGLQRVPAPPVRQGPAAHRSIVPREYVRDDPVRVARASARRSAGPALPAPAGVSCGPAAPAITAQRCNANLFLTLVIHEVPPSWRCRWDRRHETPFCRPPGRASLRWPRSASRPLTDEANRHAPQPEAIPAARRPRRNAAPDRGQPRNRPALGGRADRLPAQLHRPAPRNPGAELQGRAPRKPPHPAPARSYTGHPPGPPPGAPPHPPPATCPITAPTVSATSSRQASVKRRQQRMAHPGHGPPPHPWARRSSGTGPPPGHDASNQNQKHQRPGARRADRPGDLHLPAGRHNTHRPASGPRPYDGPRADSPPPDPSPRSAQNEARRDPSRSLETGKSWPATAANPGGNIVKEHGQTRGRDAQEIKPPTNLPGRAHRGAQPDPGSPPSASCAGTARCVPAARPARPAASSSCTSVMTCCAPPRADWAADTGPARGLHDAPPER